MNTQLVNPSASEAVSGTSAAPERPHLVLAKSVMRTMMPFLLATIEAVLDNTEAGPARAYILSDIPGAFTGDRMAAFSLARRVAAANMTRTMGQITGKIRAEFARPLHDQFAGVQRPETEEESEALDEETGLI